MSKLSLRGIFTFSAAALLASAVYGCAWLQGNTEDSEIKELDEGLKAANRETPFDEALRKLNVMLEAYDVPRTPIQSKNIGNETADKGALPSDLYIMISTAINKVGRKIVFVPFDAKYVVAESTTGGKLDRLLPEAVIAGGITGFDKDMIEKERKGEASGGWAGASGSARYNAGEGTSRITLDLNMLDYKTQSYFPGVLTSNAIIVRKDHLGWAVSGYYMGCGGSFDSAVKTKQGVHAALRFLVEFSVLELLGKYFEVPYWKCLEGSNEDTVMCQRIADRFKDMPDDRQALFVKRMLFLHGVQGVDRFSLGLTSSEVASVQQEMRARNCSTMGDLYVSLWKSVPLNEAAGRVVKDRKRRQSEAAQLAEEQRQRQEADKAKAAEQLKLHQARVAQYAELVKKADELFANASYGKASEAYKSASSLFSGEAYPKQKLAEIVAIESAARERDASFSSAVSEGDRLFEARDYDGAKKSFAVAAQLKPDAPELKERLEKLGKFLKAKAPTGIGAIDKDDFKDDNN